MNQFVLRNAARPRRDADDAPVILDDYANTASAGSIIAFHQHSADLAPGDVGVICSFGAGYSVGSVIVRRTVGGIGGSAAALAAQRSSGASGSSLGLT